MDIHSCDAFGVYSTVVRRFAFGFFACVGEPASSVCYAQGDGTDSTVGVREVMLTAPLQAPRASFFHAALEIPPLETARPLSPGDVVLRVESNHSRSVARRDIDGNENKFDGLFHEWLAMKAAVGALRFVELQARAALSGWDEQLDRFFLRDSAGAPIVENEDDVVLGTGASNRHDNLADVVLGAKGLLLDRSTATADLALAGSVKIPVARPHDLTNAGTTDVNLFALATLPMRVLTLHAALGVGFPVGRQNLFVREAEVDLVPYYHGGLALNWSLCNSFAVAAQLEGNSSAFQGIEFLQHGPLTTFFGLRWLGASLSVEGGAGLGLIDGSSYDYASQFAVAYLFGD